MNKISLSHSSEWCWTKSTLPPLSDPRDVLQSTKSGKWTKTTQFPSQIHVELIAAGEIKDPFKGLAEADCQWVGETDWVYKTNFSTDKRGNTMELVFEGLDTFASVFLNDQQVLSTDNMFQDHRVDVTKHVVSNNTLVIVFSAPFCKARTIEEDNLGPGKHNLCWNGDSSRLWARKAGYNFGWDWGPVLMTSGPYRPIHLEIHPGTRVADFYTHAKLDNSLKKATIAFEVVIASNNRTSGAITFRITSPAGKAFEFGPQPLDFPKGESIDKHWVELNESDLDGQIWWSAGLGKPALWKAEVDLTLGTSSKQTVTKSIGIRKLELVQEALADEPGTTFRFEVNNVPIWCGGSNWIPIDSFITNGTEERYRAWLQLLIDGGQNMIRVWGGGIYENDCFYDICDELGILCWQDFMFGCGQYPVTDALLKSIAKEAKDNVTRLRHHPCLAIFAGNNEDYQVAEQLKLDWDPKDDNPENWRRTNFPARYIYEKLLPDIVHELCNVYYHPGSPWGGAYTSDPTVGDIHQWNVWHGSQEAYQDWDKLGGRFISEFGMQGYPDLKTTDYYLEGNIKERYPQSKTVGYHNKADGYERRLELYLVENIRHAFDMESYTYGTQFIQAETLSTAYRLWRRNFKGPGKYYNAGALVWQLNDVYPCTSWSIVDYFLRPKPSYYAIKQSLYPLAVGLKRSVTKTFPDKLSSRFEEKDQVEIWTVSSLLHSVQVTLILEAFRLSTGERVWKKEEKRTLPENRGIEWGTIEVPKVGNDTIVLSAKLLDDKEEIVSRFSVYPEPYKFLTFAPEKEIKLVVDRKDETLIINSSHPIKGFILYFSEDVKLSDNALDLIPGDTRVIQAKGLTKQGKVWWRFLGDSKCP